MPRDGGRDQPRREVESFARHGRAVVDRRAGPPYRREQENAPGVVPPMELPADRAAREGGPVFPPGRETEVGVSDSGSTSTGADGRDPVAHERARVQASRQGLLFTDDLPEVPEDMGYRGPTACSAAGITYRQLDYWARTGLVEPSIRNAAGSGSQRLYSFRDILVLKVVKRLLDTGVSLQQIRTAVGELRERGIDDLAQITLMSDGASVYALTSPDEIVDLLQGGQ